MRRRGGHGLVDFRLYFFGEIGRPDLIDRSGVAPAGATHDQALYREIAPQNITFDGSHKIFRIGPRSPRCSSTLRSAVQSCDGRVGLHLPSHPRQAACCHPLPLDEEAQP